jgi:hypothetical protein
MYPHDFIESDRNQAQVFAMQAAILEDIGSEAAPIYRQLVALCDLKINILQNLTALTRSELINGSPGDAGDANP